MALRNQPYFPLYVQDYLTDEKLNECSAASQGIYIKILCIMHKSKEYGCILLQQKDQQDKNFAINFANKLVRHLPFTIEEIKIALEELIFEDVLQVNKEYTILSQKRMIRDNEISIKRSKSGSKGGFATAKGIAKGTAKGIASPEDEIEYEIEDKDINKNKDINNIKPIIELWNDFAKKNNLSQIIKLTKSRETNIKQRLKESEFDLGLIFDNILASKFLLGDNDKDWKVSFDFIFGSTNNYIKILEGKYKGVKNGKPAHIEAEQGKRFTVLS